MDEQLDTPDVPEPTQPQDSLESAASRLAGLMGDDGSLNVPAQDESEEQTAEPAKAAEPVKAEPETVEVDLDGYKVQLPKDKAELFEKGQLRQSDYTRKTMELAEQRKAVEAEKAAAAQERGLYAQQLQALSQQISSAVQSGQLAPPDPSLLDTDPVSYLRQKDQWERAQNAWNQAQVQQQLIQRQQAEEQARHLQQTLATQQEQLLAKLPDWKDEARAREGKAAVRSYLESFGYTPDEIGAAVDHRAIVLAHKAMQFDKLVAEQKAVVEKKVPPPQPKAVKPGAAQESAPNPINKSAMQRLRSGGRIDDAAAAIASLLG